MKRGLKVNQLCYRLLQAKELTQWKEDWKLSSKSSGSNPFSANSMKRGLKVHSQAGVIWVISLSQWKEDWKRIRGHKGWRLGHQLNEKRIERYSLDGLSLHTSSSSSMKRGLKVYCFCCDFYDFHFLLNEKRIESSFNIYSNTLH